jgi:hypothetical protein
MLLVQFLATIIELNPKYVEIVMFYFKLWVQTIVSEEDVEIIW